MLQSASSSSGSPTLRPTIGPYTVPVDSLFAQARDNVLARAEIVNQLALLQQRVDLAAAVNKQRDVLLAGVDSKISRARQVGDRLHDLLVAALPADQQVQLAKLLWEARGTQSKLLDAVARQRSLLESAEESAGTLEFRALETEWTAEQRDIVLALESTMLSVVLTELNTALAATSAPTMRVGSLDGLRETLTNEKVVLTSSFTRLDNMIQGRRDGSFGIAGPRGVGKSTLIRFFATAPGLPDQPRGPLPRLGIVVSAPVEYDARDFVLHLYSEVCKRVAAEDPRYSGHGAQFDRPQFPPDRRSRILGPAVIAPASLAGGYGLLILAILHRLSLPANILADAGAALLGLAVVLLFGSRVSLRFPQSTLAAASGTAVVGLILFLANGGWQSAGVQLLGGVALLVVGVIQVGGGMEAYRRRQLGDLDPPSPLVGLALDHLRQIRFQQSHNTERTMTLKLSAAPLPVSLDAGGKQGTTLQERTKGYPELVADLRSFLTTVAKEHELIIGIDELDKLRSAEKVENFLNDIKGIFGATGCFFLVSVSEDAAAGFERRGTPFRDVFDSSFDDVISVAHLDLTASRKVLYGLLFGWTDPFVGLCHVSSGGLARDLMRSARELITYRDQDNEIELGQAALGMYRREAEARLRAVRHELMRKPFDTNGIALLNLIADFTMDDATGESFKRRHGELQKWATSALEEARSAIRLASELAAFMLFAATVLEFFVPSSIAARLREAETTPAKSLAILAAARQTLSASPQMSLASLGRFRTAWALD